jgi:hypothetical protein
MAKRQQPEVGHVTNAHIQNPRSRHGATDIERNAGDSARCIARYVIRRFPIDFAIMPGAAGKQNASFALASGSCRA